MMALPTIPNLSSTTLVALLHQVLHPSTSGLSQPPALKSFVLVYRTISVSEAMHKAAMFKILTVEDATRILEVLVQWAEAGVEGEKVVQWNADKLEAASDGSAMKSVCLSLARRKLQIELNSFMTSYRPSPTST